MKFVIFCCTLVLLAACETSDSQTEIDPETIPEAERYGGTAVVSIHTDPRSLNTLVNADLEAAELQLALQSPRLVQYDGSLEPVPLLAERWDTVRVAPDTLQLTFHLRRDVRWHDGTPTAAEDVSFFQEKIPGLYSALGVTPEDTDPEAVAGTRSPLFFADEGALPFGVRAMAHLAVDYLGNTQ
jgi:ABC-type transport system substrate-binding protein